MFLPWEWQKPMINLAGHDPYSNYCTGLSSDIRSVKAEGIKVILSIGGRAGSYSLASTEDPRQVATYLWNNFFRSSISPYQRCCFRWSRHWMNLQESKKVYLTAAPECPFPNVGSEVPLKWVILITFGFTAI